MTALRESDIEFPIASRSVHSVLSDLRKRDLSISNRLRSIKKDSEFVQKVAMKYGLPLVANERCGSWYIPPTNKSASVYFKSTDGHFGQWLFSLRRLNLQVLKILGDHGGCIIVDSTRRGKSMPDALSKTVPIWIATMNRLLFPDRADMHVLDVPMNVVSESEREQIERRLPNILQSARSLNLNVEALRKDLSNKPMRPTWITPAGLAQSSSQMDDDHCFHQIVLCTASSQDSDDDLVQGYAQGAADDHESWGLGLDADMFWNNIAELLLTSEDGLPEMIRGLVEKRQVQFAKREPRCIEHVQIIFVGSVEGVRELYADFDIIVVCSLEKVVGLQNMESSNLIDLRCASGKNGSRQLRTELSKLEQVRSRLGTSTKVLILDADGKDIAVGVALALLCRYFDAEGKILPPDAECEIASKANIKRRLSWIMSSIPDASPSRATLQSVNSYLMG